MVAEMISYKGLIVKFYRIFGIFRSLIFFGVTHLFDLFYNFLNTIKNYLTTDRTQGKSVYCFIRGGKKTAMVNWPRFCLKKGGEKRDIISKLH